MYKINASKSSRLELKFEFRLKAFEYLGLQELCLINPLDLNHHGIFFFGLPKISNTFNYTYFLIFCWEIPINVCVVNFNCCQSITSLFLHSFVHLTPYGFLNQFSFVDFYFFIQVYRLNVSLNFRMVLFLYIDTFHLITDFIIITKEKMRNKKVFRFLFYLLCLSKTIPITANNYFHFTQSRCEMSH